MSLNVRRKSLVDHRLQLAVALRSVVYWFFCMVSLACLILCWWMISRPDMMITGGATELWRQFGPPFVAGVLLLPVVVLDAIRVSNRMAGPMYRLRKAMHQLAQGEQVAPLSVRKNDWWRDAVEDFNVIAAKLRQTPETSTPPAADAEASGTARGERPSKEMVDRDSSRVERDLETELEHMLAE